MVGAVIVKDGKIISEGWHKKYGGPHAEAEAITKAKPGDIRGATLYCNLEPCCHTNKQTPPCTPLIIRHKIKRVVISNIDPNPGVSGQGIEQLKNAGIEVISRVHEQEGEFLNRFYFNFIKNNRPYITLKIAQSLDGKITKEMGTQTSVTGKEAKRFVHQLRAQYDAVMIGANTVNIDNPALTVREIKGRNPLKIIIDGDLDTSAEAVVFNDKSLLITSKNADKNKLAAFKEKKTQIILLSPDNSGKISFNEINNILAEQKITSVLVEGGADIASQIISKQLYDELIVLQSPEIYGRGLSAFNLTENIKLKIKSIDKLGEDLKIIMQ